jgi:acyl-CoA synthetase (AMP-forming)/AMP-acid ligase II
MMSDADAKLMFTDAACIDTVGNAHEKTIPRIALDGSQVGRSFEEWLAPAGARPEPVDVQPDWAFNIIYSSGTTGTPKGIVQAHAMRWSHVRRGGGAYSYGPGSVTISATPLYSNTTLVVFFPTIAWGGTAVLLKRWPGGLVEFYGMTEGGGSCILEAHTYPDKLHTVGKPAEGHDIRLIDDEGKVVAPGEMGEVVGRSGSMMTGYHKQPAKTREAEWYSADGLRFIRTGDVGRFDADGFLTLFDRKKDMVISGGFNIYPSDLESVMRQHAAVADVAVIGVPSEQWGETPVAYVVRKAGDATTEADLLQWFNQQVGKTQRLAGLRFIGELPRSAIGKVLKRELRDQYVAAR